jgi:YVTN family beta-propeller protein
MKWVPASAGRRPFAGVPSGIAVLVLISGLLSAQEEVIGTVPVGAGPFGVSVNPQTRRVYVANQGSATVSVIDENTHLVISTVPVGGGPTAVAVDASRNRIYVTSRFSDSVFVLDGTSDTVIATVPVGRDPRGIALDVPGNRIFVTNSRTGTVSVINGATLQVMATHPDGRFPFEVEYHAPTDRLYISNFGGNTVTVMNASNGASVATVTVGLNPGAVAIDVPRNRVYVPGFASGSVWVIDIATHAVLAVVSAGIEPLYGVAIDSPRGLAYVTNFGGDNVAVLDLGANALLRTFPVGDGPLGAALDTALGRLHVANASQGTVSVIRTQQNGPPTADAGPDQVVATGSCTATVTLDGRGSSDPDGDPLTYRWTGPFGEATGATPTVQLPLGAHTVTLSVSDGKGGTASDTVRIAVMDVTPPSITNISATPHSLWPPNHVMVPVTVTAAATDNCDPNPVLRVVSVSSNEPESGLGSGDTAPDWQITGPMTVSLRAERSALGTGRIYTITLAADDASGNRGTATVQVLVPRDSHSCPSCGG